MYCKYCGKKLAEGEECTCRKIKEKKEETLFYEEEIDNNESETKTSKKVMIIALAAVSAIIVGLIVGTIVPKILFPDRSEKISTVQDEDIDDSVEDEKTPNKEKDSDSADKILAGIIQKYENEELDYIKAKEKLMDLDFDTLNADESQKAKNFQAKIETDLKKSLDDYVTKTNYKAIFGKFDDIEDELKDDQYASDLRKLYESQYIEYLKKESDYLVKSGNSQQALNLLNEAQDCFKDKNSITNLIQNVQDASKSGDYVIAGSDSRYLTSNDTKNMTIQQINYAKNEIYARHGRKFQSKELQDYFNSKSWYSGTVDPSSFNTDVLNDYEKKNAEMLHGIEFSMNPNGYQLDAN